MNQISRKQNKQVKKKIKASSRPQISERANCHNHNIIPQKSDSEGSLVVEKKKRKRGRSMTTSNQHQFSRKTTNLTRNEPVHVLASTLIVSN